MPPRDEIDHFVRAEPADVEAAVQVATLGRDEHVGLDLRVLLEQSVEVLFAQPQQFHVRLGHHRRRAPTPVEQRRLAEVVAGNQHGDQPVLAAHLAHHFDTPPVDDVKGLALLVLREDGLPGGAPFRLELAGDLQDLVVLETLEDMDGLQPPEIGFRILHRRGL